MICGVALSSLFAGLVAAGRYGQDFSHIEPISKLKAQVVLRAFQQDREAVIHFEQEYYSGAPVLVNISYLALRDDELHALHIHRWGNTTENCDSVGLHFNPDLVPHGGPLDYIRHVGDLGNIQGAKNVQLYERIIFYDNRISLFGRNSIIGRAAVIHAKKDDHGKVMTKASKQRGSAGDKLICGVITRGKSEFFGRSTAGPRPAVIPTAANKPLDANVRFNFAFD